MRPRLTRVRSRLTRARRAALRLFSLVADAVEASDEPVEEESAEGRTVHRAAPPDADAARPTRMRPTASRARPTPTRARPAPTHVRPPTQTRPAVSVRVPPGVPRCRRAGRGSLAVRRAALAVRREHLPARLPCAGPRRAPARPLPCPADLRGPASPGTAPPATAGRHPPYQMPRARRPIPIHRTGLRAVRRTSLLGPGVWGGAPVVGRGGEGSSPPQASQSAGHALSPRTGSA